MKPEVGKGIRQGNPWRQKAEEDQSTDKKRDNDQSRSEIQSKHPKMTL